MQVYTDQLGRSVEVRSTKRIISLVPSQTELLYDFGLDDEVVGLTKFCIHPKEWFHSKPRVGGTKNLNIKLIEELEPDLIIANKEENTKEHIDLLSENYPVYVSDVNSLESALEMIMAIGAITGKTAIATSISDKIVASFRDIKADEQLTTCYLIWKDPYMTVGGDSFINDIMERSGFQNVFSKLTRYPQLKIEDIKASGANLILLSSEPYPFKEKHLKELQEQLPGKLVTLADGEMFSWYGSRLINAPSYLQQLRHEILIKFGHAAADG